MTKAAVLFTGNRDWTDDEAVIEQIEALPTDTLVIHGDAKGADKMVDHTARTCGLTVVRVPYPRPGDPAAGMERNDTMLDILEGLQQQGYSVRVFGFTKDINIRRSGTNGTLRRAMRRGLPTDWTGREQ